MKKKLLYTLILFLFIFIPKPIFAQEEIPPTDETQVDCIDLEAIYEEINNSSQAVTGTKNSIDAVKKINTTASLMNIISVFLGDRIYCVKDEVAASKSVSLKSQGLLGMIDNANTGILSMYPDINVGNHIAQRFVPGYGENNSLLAYPNVPGNEDWEDDGENEEQRKEAESIADQFKNRFLNIGNEFIEEQGDIVVVEEPEEEVEDNSSGYSYLKDTIQLDRIWSQSLNIVYVLYVLIFIIVGFMIMFRKKLQGNVTVTFSRALPNLIISLILATFSFAIVGLMMDVGKITMNVSRGIFSEIYKDINENPSNNETYEIIETKNVWHLANGIYTKTNADKGLGDALKKIPLVGNALARVITGSGEGIGAGITRAGLYGLTYKYLNKALPDLLKETDPSQAVDVEATGGIVFAEGTVEILAPLVFVAEWGLKATFYNLGVASTYLLLGQILKILVIIVICFYAAFKVFIALLTTYLKLFGNVILAPFQMLMGAIPGNTNQITNWFKSVIANCLIPTAIFTVINASAAISASIYDPSKFNFFSNGGILWPDIIISFRSIIIIAGYLFASSMPKIINGALGVGTSKSMMGAGDDMKQSMKKIPLVGGMFN